MRVRDVNERWQLLKEVMQNLAECIVGQSQQTKQKTWVSDKTFQLGERKRQAKRSRPIACFGEWSSVI